MKEMRPKKNRCAEHLISREDCRTNEFKLLAANPPDDLQLSAWAVSDQAFQAFHRNGP